MSGREGTVLRGRDPNSVRGGAQAPAGCLHGPTEVPPTRVGPHEAHHPGTRGGLQTVRKGTLGGIPPGYLTKGGGAHAQPDNHSIGVQACRARNNGPNPDSKG